MPIRTVPPRSSWTGDFVGQLESQYQLLGLTTPPVVDELQTALQRPELLLFFGDQPWAPNASLQADLATYAGNAAHLLPVIEKATDAPTHLPKEVLAFNAFQRTPHGKHWPDALVDEVLALTWQRRPKRKIFISYRRTDAEAVAQQLYERYAKRSFEVFLDDVTIPRGVDFQASLCQWLDDADAVLLLISPDIASSEWVRREIGLATTRRIGLLGVIWPNARFPDGKLPAAAGQVPADRQLSLDPAQLGGAAPGEQTLDPACLGEVDRLLFTGRSQAIASRLRDLVVKTTKRLATDYDVQRISSDGDVELIRRSDRAEWLARVVPFRPNVAELWRWWRELSPLGKSGIVIAYPELDENDENAVALREICSVWGKTLKPELQLLVARV